MGGEIVVASEVGKGSQFTITLPMELKQWILEFCAGYASEGLFGFELPPYPLALWDVGTGDKGNKRTGDIGNSFLADEIGLGGVF